MRPEFAKLQRMVKKADPEGDEKFLRKAYRVADRAHQGQQRLSGEPFISHVLEVAKILAGLGMDTKTVSAGLLHDVLEDTDLTRKDLEEDFGKTVARLVDGVTKIGAMHVTEAPRHGRTQAGGKPAEDVGGHGAGFITFVTLNESGVFSKEEWSEATRQLPESGLLSALDVVIRALDGAGDQYKEYWDNRALPYLKSIWPTSLSAKSPVISERLGRLCVSTRQKFPEAFNELRSWLEPVKYPGILLRQLAESKLCTEFPKETLEFLSALTSLDMDFVPKDLDQCLNEIRVADESLNENQDFIRLRDFYDKRGVG